MRWHRSVHSAAMIALAVVAAVIVLTPAPARAATILVVNPSSISAGFPVELQATCDENVNPAFVNSKAFGSVTLVPENGDLNADVTVPRTTRSGTYLVNMTCADGQRASTRLTVVGRGAPPNADQGPHTGGGQMASSLAGKLALFGGLGAIAVGLGFWLMRGTRRRSAV